MKTKHVVLIFSILLSIVFGFLHTFSEAKAKNDRNIFGSENSCNLNMNRRWGWTLEGAWMSTNKTGDWKTDNWFYKIKPQEPIVVLQEDSFNGYYLVCFDFGSENGYDTLVGWIQKDKILLQSEITPISP